MRKQGVPGYARVARGAYNGVVGSRTALSTQRALGAGREAVMRRLSRVMLIASLVILIVALAGGCGPTRQAVRSDGPTVELRLPPAEAVDLRLRHEQVPRPPRPVPLSVSEESEGRWLTLFEMNVTPSEAAGVPPAPGGSR